MEAVFGEPIKIIVCVRNPAEILTSFERTRKENPLYFNQVDLALRNNNSIAGRAFHYAGPDGTLGRSHRNIKDAIVMGYLNRMLFVDYSRFCSSPKAQTRRIYEFLSLPHYDHNFENIEQVDPLTHNLKVNPIAKKTVNCVEYLGLELYEQYNREIFWNAWV
jgi:sulfotransferase